MKKYIRVFSIILFTIFLSQCSSELETTNPYDTKAPEYLKQKAVIKGKIDLEYLDWEIAEGGDLTGTQIVIGDVDTATTIKDGEFSRKNIPAGTYLISIQRKKYQSKVLSVVLGIGGEVNLGTIKLTRKRAQISGKVTNTTSSGADSLGLEGVNIVFESAYADKTENKEPKTSPFFASLNNKEKTASNSDDNGEYRSQKMPLGKYKLKYKKKGFVLEGCTETVVELKENGSTLEPTKMANEVGLFSAIKLEEKIPSGGSKFKEVFRTNERTLFLELFSSAEQIEISDKLDSKGQAVFKGKFSKIKDLQNKSGLIPYKLKAEVLDKELKDGSYPVFVKFKKGNCKETRAYSKNIFYDTTPPNIRLFQINSGNTHVKTNNPETTLEVYDPDNGTVPYYKLGEIDEIKGQNFSAYNGSRFLKFLFKATKDGNYSIQASFKDEAGNVASKSQVIYLDKTAPEIDYLRICPTEELCQSSLSLVNKMQVFIHLKRKDNSASSAKDFQISNESTFKGQDFRTFSDRFIWTLDNCKLTKGLNLCKVYLKFRDKAGNLKDAEISVSVDSTPPSAISLKPRLPQWSQDQDSFYNFNSDDLEILYQYQDADFAEVLVTPFGDFPDFKKAKTFDLSSPTSKFKPGAIVNGLSSKQFKRLKKQFFVRFKDKAGNLSSVLSFKGLFNSEIPASGSSESLTGNWFKSENKLYTSQDQVDFQIKSDDAQYYNYSISDNPSSCDKIKVDENKTVSSIKKKVSVNLGAQDGQKFISFRFFNHAGNGSKCQNFKVERDTKVPTVISGKDLMELTKGSLLINSKLKNKFPNAYKENNFDLKFNFSKSDTWQILFSQDENLLGATFADFEPIKKDFSFNLKTFNNFGENKIYFQFKDKAGNLSPKLSKTIKVIMGGGLFGNVNLAGETDHKDVSVTVENCQLSLCKFTTKSKGGSPSDGSFEFIGLPKGAKNLIFSKAGYESVRLTNTLVKTDQVIEISPTIILKKATGNFSGNVILEGENNFSGAIVEVAGKVTSTDPNGKFILTGIPIGKWPCTIKKDGFETKQNQIEIKSFQTTTLNFRLNPQKSNFRIKDNALSSSISITKDLKVGIEIIEAPKDASQIKFFGDLSSVDSILNYKIGEYTAYSKTTFKGLTLKTGDGPKSIKIQFKDSGGSESGIQAASVTLDQGKPTISSIKMANEALFTIKGSNSSRIFTKNRTVILTLDAKDSISNLSKIKLWENGNSSSPSIINFNENISQTLSAGDGNKVLSFQVIDQPGNESAVFKKALYLDTTAPQNINFHINQKAQSKTNSKLVTLNIYAEDLAAINPKSPSLRMMLANDNSFTGKVWMNYINQLNHELSAGPDGLRTVWIKFLDPSGNESSPVSANINLDTLGPNGTGLFVIKQGRLYINKNQGISYDNLNKVPIEIVGMDPADLDKMELRLDTNFDPNKALPFNKNPKISLKLNGVPKQDGYRKVYGRFYDQAGNTQNLASQIFIDFTAPQFSATANEGSEFFKDSAVNQKITLKLGLDQPDDTGIKRYAISEDVNFPGLAASGDQDSTDKKTSSSAGLSLSPEHQLSGPEGIYYLHVKMWDKAGNSTIYSGKDGKGLKIIFDKTKPIFSNILIQDSNSGASGTEISANKNSSLKITGKISDSGSGVELITIKGEEIKIAPDGSFALDKVPLTEGKNDFKITAKDRAGNPADSVIVTVNYDSQSPYLTLIDENEWQSGFYFNATKVSAYLSVSEDASLQTNPMAGATGSILTKISSNKITQGSNKIEFTFSGEGSHEVEFWAEDDAGNSSAPIKDKRNKIKVFIDVQKPTISVDSGPPSLTKDSYVDFVLSVSEPSGFYSSGIDPDSVTVNDIFPCQQNLNGKFDCNSIALTKGENNLNFKAQDKAGNSHSLSLKVNLDNDTPIFSVSADENGKWVQGSTTEIEANLLEEANIDIKVAEPSGSSCPQTPKNPSLDCYPKSGSTCQKSPASSLEIPILNLKSGLNCIYFELSDNAGNKFTSITKVFRDDQAPSIELKQLLVAANTINPSLTTSAWEFKDASNKVLFSDEAFITNLSTSKITIKGSFNDDDKNGNLLNDSGIKALLLNGIDILDDQGLNEGTVSGDFSYLFTLQPGLNRIEIAVLDQSGRKTNLRKLDVFYDNLAPRTIISSDKIEQYATSLEGHIYFSSSESGEVEVIKTNPSKKAITFSASPLNISKAYVTQAVTAIDSNDSLNGSYEFKLIPKDRAYPSPNQPSASDLQSAIIIVDTLKPEIVLKSPTNLSSKDPNLKSITVELTVTDATSGIDKVSIGGAKAEVNGNVYSRTVNIAEGRNKFVAEAFDKAGNSKVYSFSYQRDSEKPVLNLNTITEYAKYVDTYYVKNSNSSTPTTTLSLSGTVNEAVIIKMALSAGSNTSNYIETIDSGGSFTSTKVVFTNEGSNNLSLYAEDTFGNQSSSETLKFVYDKTKPTASVTDKDGKKMNPSLVSKDKSNLSFLVDLVEDHGIVKVLAKGVECTLSDTQPTGYSATRLRYECDLTLSEGENKIAISAFDRAGNESSKLTSTVTLDSRPPTLNLEPGYAGKWFKADKFDLKGTLIEDSDIKIVVTNTAKSYSWSKDLNNQKAGSVDLPVELKEGSNVVEFSVSDAAGNQFKTGEITLKLDQVAPNTINLNKITATASSGPSKVWSWIPPKKSGQVTSSESTVNLEGSFDDALSGVKKITINGTAAVLDETNKTFTISDFYLQPGTNILLVFAEDQAGNISNSYVQSIDYDKSPPRFSLDSSSKKIWTNKKDVSLNFTSTEDGSFKVYIFSPSSPSNAKEISCSKGSSILTGYVEAFCEVDLEKDVTARKNAKNQADYQGNYKVVIISEDQALPIANKSDQYANPQKFSLAEINYDKTAPALLKTKAPKDQAYDSNNPLTWKTKRDKILLDIEVEDPIQLPNSSDAEISGITAVYINGIKAKPGSSSGRFSAEVGIGEGENNILVEIADNAGNSQVFSALKATRDTKEPKMLNVSMTVETHTQGVCEGVTPTAEGCFNLFFQSDEDGIFTYEVKRKNFQTNQFDTVVSPLGTNNFSKMSEMGFGFNSAIINIKKNLGDGPRRLFLYGYDDQNSDGLRNGPGKLYVRDSSGNKFNYLVINIDTKKPTITRLPFASEGSPGSSNYWPGEFIQNDTIITTKHPTKDNDFSIQLKIEDPKNPDYSSGVLTVSANENTLSSETSIYTASIQMSGGRNNFNVLSEDKARNWANANFDFFYDIVAPQLSLDFNYSNFFTDKNNTFSYNTQVQEESMANCDFKFEFLQNNSLKYSFEWNDKNCNSSLFFNNASFSALKLKDSNNADVTSLPDGMYNLKLTATDKMGNNSSISSNYFVDTKTPQFVKFNPNKNIKSEYCTNDTNPIIFNIYIDDHVDINDVNIAKSYFQDVQINGSPGVFQGVVEEPQGSGNYVFEYAFSLKLNEGTQGLNLDITDKANNRLSNYSLSASGIKLDTQQPVINSLSPSDGSHSEEQSNNPINLKVEAEESIQVKYKINDGSLITIGSFASPQNNQNVDITSQLADKLENRIFLMVSDKCGNNFTKTINYGYLKERDKPIINSLTPSTVTLWNNQQGNVEVTISGSKIASDTYLKIGSEDYDLSSCTKNGSALGMTRWSEADSCKVNISQSNFSKPGLLEMSLYTPFPGGGDSATKSINIPNIAPTVDPIQAQTRTPGSSSPLQLNITGSNFSKNASATYDGNVVSVIRARHNEMDLVIPSGSINENPDQKFDLIISNSGGGSIKTATTQIKINPTTVVPQGENLSAIEIPFSYSGKLEPDWDTKKDHDIAAYKNGGDVWKQKSEFFTFRVFGQEEYTIYVEADDFVPGLKVVSGINDSEIKQVEDPKKSNYFFGVFKGPGSRGSVSSLKIEIFNRSKLNGPYSNYSLKIHKGLSQGSYTLQRDFQNLSGLSTINDLDFADLNGDGIKDIYFYEAYGKNLEVNFGKIEADHWKISSKTGYSTSNTLVKALNGDFNGDGISDLLVISSTGNNGNHEARVLVYDSNSDNLEEYGSAQALSNFAKITGADVGHANSDDYLDFVVYGLQKTTNNQYFAIYSDDGKRSGIFALKSGVALPDNNGSPKNIHFACNNASPSCDIVSSRIVNNNDDLEFKSFLYSHDADHASFAYAYGGQNHSQLYLPKALYNSNANHTLVPYWKRPFPKLDHTNYSSENFNQYYLEPEFGITPRFQIANGLDYFSYFSLGRPATDQGFNSTEIRFLQTRANDYSFIGNQMGLSSTAIVIDTAFLELDFNNHDSDLNSYDKEILAIMAQNTEANAAVKLFLIRGKATADNQNSPDNGGILEIETLGRPLFTKTEDLTQDGIKEAVVVSYNGNNFGYELFSKGRKIASSSNLSSSDPSILKRLTLSPSASNVTPINANNDHHPDFLVFGSEKERGQESSLGVSLIMSKVSEEGALSYTVKGSRSLDCKPREIKVGNFTGKNEDSFAVICAASYQTKNRVYIYRVDPLKYNLFIKEGSLTLASPQGMNFEELSVGDFNRDGFDDLAVAQVADNHYLTGNTIAEPELRVFFNNQGKAPYFSNVDFNYSLFNQSKCGGTNTQKYFNHKVEDLIALKVDKPSLEEKPWHQLIVQFKPNKHGTYHSNCNPPKSNNFSNDFDWNFSQFLFIQSSDSSFNYKNVFNPYSSSLTYEVSQLKSIKAVKTGDIVTNFMDHRPDGVEDLVLHLSGSNNDTKQETLQILMVPSKLYDLLRIGTAYKDSGQNVQLWGAQNLRSPGAGFSGASNFPILGNYSGDASIYKVNTCSEIALMTNVGDYSCTLNMLNQSNASPLSLSGGILTLSAEHRIVNQSTLIESWKLMAYRPQANNQCTVREIDQQGMAAVVMGMTIPLFPTDANETSSGTLDEFHLYYDEGSDQILDVFGGFDLNNDGIDDAAVLILKNVGNYDATTELILMKFPSVKKGLVP